MQLSQPRDSDSDVFSDPIYFRDGVPVGTLVETVAHVSKKKILSFPQPTCHVYANKTQDLINERKFAF